MTTCANKSLLICGKACLQDGCKINGISRLNLFKNKKFHPFQIAHKNTIFTSVFLKHEANIVKSYCKEIVIPKNVPLHEFIWQKNIKLHGDKTALVDGITGTSYTYEEATTASIRFGNGLCQRRFQKGDVLALFLPNCPEYIISLTGVIGAGGVVTTIDPMYTKTEVARQLEMSGASFILTKSNMLPVTKEAIRKCSREIQIVILDERMSDALFYKDVIQDGEQNWSKVVLESNANNDEVGLLPYSSGTTGLPKGVMLSAQNIISNVCQLVYGKELDFIEETTDKFQPKTVCVLPMFHMFGLNATSLCTLHAGGQVISLPSFDPATFLNTMQKYKPTFMHFTPPLLDFCANDSKVELKHLETIKYVMVGAAPVGETLIKDFKRKAPNIQLRELYGMTELTSVGALAIADLDQPGSCGVLMPNTKAKILDLDTGKALGPNQAGEICFKGPQVMKGYLNREKSTLRTIRDGWLHSGDIAFYDEINRIYIVDRLKELIKVKGFQVPPAELEDLIRSHPLTADVAVIGLPDPVKGEVPRAYIVIKSEVKESKEECRNQINSFVNKHVAEYKKLVGGIEFVEVIPKSPSGKILRKNLKAKFIDSVGFHGVHSK